jgi:hypothetical protein
MDATLVAKAARDDNAELGEVRPGPDVTGNDTYQHRGERPWFPANVEGQDKGDRRMRGVSQKPNRGAALGALAIEGKKPGVKAEGQLAGEKDAGIEVALAHQSRAADGNRFAEVQSAQTTPRAERQAASVEHALGGEFETNSFYAG